MTTHSKEKNKDWQLEINNGCGCAAMILAAGISLFLLSASTYIPGIIKLIDKALK